jgi:tetratricopeptide (TPR) repeat protein
MRAALLLLAFASPALARGPGTSAAPIFKLSFGPRASGLAGAYAAVADDADATLWNPAGLAVVPQPQGAIAHSSMFTGINFDHFSAAAPLGPRGGLGGHFAYMTTGGIDRTREDPGGSFDAAASGGQFTDSEFKFGVGAAGSPAPWLSLGAGLDYFRDSVDQNSADGVLLDLGALAHSGIMSYGVSLLNAGPQVRGRDSPPTLARLGVAARPSERFLASIEYDRHFDTLENVLAFGMEYQLASSFLLRFGWRHADADGLASGLAGGFGFIMGAFQVDYALNAYGALGYAHQIGVSYKFGPERGRPKPSKPEPPPTKEPEATVSPEERFTRADMLITSKVYGKAKEELAAALAPLAAEDRRRIRYFDRMGEIALAENDADAAQVFFGDGLRLGASLGLSDPDVADAYAGMGFCLAAKGNRALATRFLEKAREFGPSLRARDAVEAKLKELKAAKR